MKEEVDHSYSITVSVRVCVCVFPPRLHPLFPHGVIPLGVFVTKVVIFLTEVLIWLTELVISKWSFLLTELVILFKTGLVINFRSPFLD